MKKFILFLMMLTVSAFVFAQEAEEIENAPAVSEEVTENVVQAEEADVTVAVEEFEAEVAETAETLEVAETVANEESEESDVPAVSTEELMEIANAEFEAAKEELKAREEEINAFYLDKFRTAANKKETVAAEVGLQKALQAERDSVRLVEDDVYKARRTEEENSALEAKKAELDAILLEKNEEINIKIGAEEKISAAEQIKASIWALWEDVRIKSEKFNADRDNQAQAKIDEINNAPYTESETDSSGEPTRTALQRRTNLCNEELALAKSEEDAYLKQLKAEIAETEKTYFAELKKAYAAVDSGKYETTSFTDDIVLRIGNFNGEKGYWKATVSSCIFNHTGLLDLDFELTYEEVTGKKFISADQMTPEQFTQFKADIALYDHLFRINSNAIFAKVNYEVIHWKEASEYRFVPRRLEVIKVGENPKVIHKENRIQAKNFIDYTTDVFEVRTEEEIRKDSARAAKIVEKEQKKAGTYNPAYSYNANGTNDFVNQKGRGAFVISVVAEPKKGDSISLDSLATELTFGLDKYGFLGADFGIQFPFITEQIMEFGVVGGVNCKLGKHFRPYIKATANATTTYFGKAKAGAGIDFTFGIFLLNLEYNYSWNFDFNNNLNPKIDKSKLSKEDFDVKYNTTNRFSVGLGIAF